MRPTLLCLCAAAALLAAPRAAAAQASDVASYAIVVGSNAGGAGQEDLRYAERDARRVAAVLTEVGGYPADDVRTLLGASPARLYAALDAVARKVAADSAAGRRSMVFFYYSGHARASGLVLGDDEVPLDELRARITGLPATVTVVVLDACQSGAFTRAKGAEPAADFSYNASSRLDASGIAVLASSSASELSQESDFLESSYFTHHLLVALRGGGDVDRDGRVSLDEAYQYAAKHTLVATSATAIGSQHVRFEADLEGHGAVALTYPEAADAVVRLADEVAGDVLVQRRPSDAVLAEVHKVAGGAVDVPVPSGEYRVLVRTATAIHRCPATVAPGATTTVELGGCDEEPLVVATGKHATPLRNRWSVTLGLAVGGAGADEYTDTLEEFGYTAGPVRTALAVQVGRRLMPHVGVALRLTRISGETWSRPTELESMETSVTSLGLTALARAELAIDDDHAVLWTEAGVGVTRSARRFEDEEDAVETDHWHAAHLSAGAGLTIFPRWMAIGVGVEGRWMYAPTVDNLMQQTHDVGGFFLALDFTYRFQ